MIVSRAPRRAGIHAAITAMTTREIQIVPAIPAMP
jgi:hypothetical protein